MKSDHHLLSIWYLKLYWKENLRFIYRRGDLRGSLATPPDRPSGIEAPLAVTSTVRLTILQPTFVQPLLQHLFARIAQHNDANTPQKEQATHEQQRI